MRYLPLLICCLAFGTNIFAQVPANDNVSNAKVLTNVTDYCSADAEFTSVNATASTYRRASFWNTAGKDVWFKFTAIHTDVSVSVTGLSVGTSNTLIDPLIAFYSFENNVLTEKIGSMTPNVGLTTAYKGGLTIGEVYYIRISAEHDATGTFKLCVNNFDPPKRSGQDCSTALVLCSKDTFTATGVSGAGTSNREAAGTCLSVESNSAWYKFTAANNGTLTFTITPTNITDDIDWALFDLGPNGDCSNISATTAIRCAAGSGVNCPVVYYKTGLSLTATDVSEAGGCGTQDGMLRYVDMIEGHVYALLVDNFSSNNNGFTIEFGGTGEFTGPTAPINFAIQDCPVGKTVLFQTDATNYTSLKWNFGEGANPATATTAGPHLVSYQTEGEKTAVLEVYGTQDCKAIGSQHFLVSAPLVPPTIAGNKNHLCIGDTLKLSVPTIDGATYEWTGPRQFSANTASITVPITSVDQAGTYQVRLTLGCPLAPSTIYINVDPDPVAAFVTNPVFNNKFAAPITVSFFNLSKNAANYHWDFGDGGTSNLPNPSHEFAAGKFTVTLTASTLGGCTNTTSSNELVVLPEGVLAIPNSFSPNNDDINDYFNVNLANLKRYTINIFNRYGTKLFTGYNVFQSWDGTYRNTPLPVGVYYYTIIATNLKNAEINYSGSVTLIR